MKPALPAPRASHGRLALFLAALAPLVAIASEAPGEGTPAPEPLPANSKIHYPWPGGLDPRPFLLSVTRTNVDQSEALLLQWSGLVGPYRVVERADVTGGVWTAVSGQTTEQSTTVPATNGMGFLGVEGPRPDYIGGSICRGCHPTAHDGWAATAHEGALDTLKRIGQGSNPTCLPCHTVGYGLPGGFVSEAATPRLAGVQCENCHGPGGAHVSDPGNLAVRPAVSNAGMLCGGCHTDFHHPTYDEWLTAGHSRVIEDTIGNDARQRSCGSCHSGAVRLVMLNDAMDTNTPPENLPPMPTPDEAAHTGITCTVCHTAHEKTEYGSQLRNPTYSTNFLSYSTSTNTTFALQYNESVNLCGQCHNQRGAIWTGTGRPPHHSPQYNMLIGNIGDVKIAGVDLSGSTQSSHRDIAKQCTHCHTHGHGSENPSEEDPVYTGHAFQPLPENCVPCHTTEEAEAFITFRQRNTHLAIDEVKTQLDKWGETKSPEPLRTKYGKLAWEFTSAGQLSQPESGPAVSGPAASEQSLIPDEIKKSRFLLYMVEHDASYGVHNARFSTTVLTEAKKLVDTLLLAP